MKSHLKQILGICFAAFSVKLGKRKKTAPDNFSVSFVVNKYRTPFIGVPFKTVDFMVITFYLFDPLNWQSSLLLHFLAFHTYLVSIIGN